MNAKQYMNLFDNCNKKGWLYFILYGWDIKENKDFVIKEIPISPDSIEDLKRELRLIWIIIAMESEKLQILCRDKKELRYVKVE